MFAFKKFLNVFSKVVINFSDLKTFSKLYCIVLLSYLYFCLIENKYIPYRNDRFTQYYGQSRVIVVSVPLFKRTSEVGKPGSQINITIALPYNSLIKGGVKKFLLCHHQHGRAIITNTFICCCPHTKARKKNHLI